MIMKKIIETPQKSQNDPKVKDLKSQKEYCVMCGQDTGYLKSEPIDLRFFYVDGAGQLCQYCFKTTTA